MNILQKVPSVVILLGAAGSGKGTQAEFLRDELHLHFIETGRIIRDRMMAEDEFGKKMRGIVEKGGHLSDADVSAIVFEAFDGVSPSENILLDGFPRSIGQARNLEQILTSHGRDPKHIIPVYIRVDLEMAKQRLLQRGICSKCKMVFMSRSMTLCPHCGGEITKRKDDTPLAIANRLQWFIDHIMPAIEFYRTKEKFMEVDGNQSVERVHEDIVRFVQTAMKVA
ncbi:MAG: nucleoside monophosphate kinase [Parcubacteria group bacterium]|nr:nucleoside monophosphate kinase [Parcubacteria group bacterium]